MSLYNIGMFILAKASWIMKPLYTISLFLDGVIYSVVSYVYKIFMLMSQIKFSRLFDMMEPLIDRVKAVIIVLVLYKLGRSLIEYMIDPGKATSDKTGGAALVKNLFVTAALLILYPFLFGVMNDISLLIIGSNDGEYEYLGQIIDTVGGSDEGLLARFVWGSSGAADDIDMGEWLAHETLTLFLHDQDSTGSGITTEYVDQHALKINVKDGATYNFTEAHNIVDEIGVNVEYTLPFVSSIMGFYLIYSIAKVAIEIGVRMFKLIILQVLAPLAIVTIIDKGTSSKTLQTFLQTYFSVFLEAITRIAIVYIITTFVAAFIGDITSYFGDIATIQESVITRGLICIIVLVAGYKIIGILPKFIDEALGTKMASSAGGGGFGKFAAGLIGGAVGFGSGIATGIAGGAGLAGTIANAAGGAFNGARSGAKGKSVADFFKNQSANSQANRNRAQDIARRGGVGNIVRGGAENLIGVGLRQDSQIAKLDEQSALLDAYNEAAIAATKGNDITDFIKNHGMSNNDVANANSQYNQGWTGVKFGDSKDDFVANMLKYDRKYIQKQSDLEVAQRGGNAKAIAEARKALQKQRDDSEKFAKELYDKGVNHYAGNDDVAKQARGRYNKSIGAKEDAEIKYKEQKNTIANNKRQITSKDSYSRTHSGNNKK